MGLKMEPDTTEVVNYLRNHFKASLTRSSMGKRIGSYIGASIRNSFTRTWESGRSSIRGRIPERPARGTGNVTRNRVQGRREYCPIQTWILERCRSSEIANGSCLDRLRAHRCLRLCSTTVQFFPEWNKSLETRGPASIAKRCHYPSRT